MFMVTMTASYKHFEWADKGPGKAGGNITEGTERDIQVCSSPSPHTELLYIVPVHMQLFFSLQAQVLSRQMIKSYSHITKNIINNSCTSLPAGVSVC
jgi:hypothetical protein